MKNVVLVVVSFLIGMGLMLGFTQIKSPIYKQMPSPTFSVKQPPSETLKGTIIKHSGVLFFESRIATAPSELKGEEIVQQGERLITKEKSDAAIQFDTVGSFELEENTDVSFIQTLPVDFVIQQRNGAVKYTSKGNVPISIRVRSALIVNKSGILHITVVENNPIVLISTLQGMAQIGFNDLDYVSQVFPLREGQIYEYDSDQHTIINSKNK